MFKSYLKIALRTLLKNKTYAMINILGLAIGISGATLLLTYVQDEASFDKFHTKSDRIVRTVAVPKDQEEPRYFGINPPVLATTMLNEIPEVEAMTTLQTLGGPVNFVFDGVRYTERDYFVVDSTFFEVFDFELIQGDKSIVLNEPNSVVVTEKQAEKFFGRTDVVGEVINELGMGDFKITGVLKNIPVNSHLQFSMLLTNPIADEWWDRNQTNWGGGFFVGSSYFVLSPTTDLPVLTEKVNKIAHAHMDEELASVMDFEFQPLEDIHFNSGHIQAGKEAYTGDRTYSVIFSAISIFLLLIAAVNYINLATSKAMFRAKEIGVRKVVGAAKKQLIAQFLTESILITIMALLISIGLIDLSMPFFNEMIGRQFDFNWSTLATYLPRLLLITFFVGILSGIYPSFFMTRFKPVEVLKGKKTTEGSFSLRKALVVFQFVMSIVLIVTTLIVADQMAYIKKHDLGFEDENLMVIDINNGNARRNFKTMRTEFLSIPGVESVGVSSRVPGEWKSLGEIGVDMNAADGSTGLSTHAYFMAFDEGMLKTFDFKLIDGDYFSGNDQSDSLKILMNESAVKTFGLDDPIGSSIHLSNGGNRVQVHVIGVLEDFNFQSLHSEIRPMIIGAWNNPAAVIPINYFTLRVSGNISQIIEEATLVHEKFDDATGIEYHFLENQLELFYKKETEASAIFKVGAGLSIFLACLGLFGLASFTVQKRMKEIIIRKVLGASEWNLFYLLSTSFIKQVIIAFLIASPIVFLIMRDWLQGFVYSVEIRAGVFLLAGIASILVALVTVSYRSLKAANSSPVNSLRQE